MIVSAKYIARYLLDCSFRESTKRKRRIVEQFATRLWPDDNIVNIKLVDITGKGSVFLVYHKPKRKIMRPSFGINAILLGDRSHETHLLSEKESRRYVYAIR